MDVPLSVLLHVLADSSISALQVTVYLWCGTTQTAIDSCVFHGERSEISCQHQPHKYVCP